MATTSLSEHWEVFIKNEISSGRYSSASEVVRDALRNLEDRKSKLDALRSHLSEGEVQAQQGEFIAGYSIADCIFRLHCNESSFDIRFLVIFQRYLRLHWQLQDR